MKPNLFLMALLAASLAACGKSEEAAAPSAEPVVAAEPVVVEQPVADAPAAEVAAAPEAEVAMPAPAAEPTPAAPSKPQAAPAAKATPAPAVSAAPKADLAQGKQTYTQACAFCHDKGIAGAPKLGDAAAWSARMAQGKDALYATALKGKGAMPAKGGNASLSDDAVKAAVDYMVAR